MKIAVIGQVPPPHHGSNIMTGIFLRALDENAIAHTHINKVFSKTGDEVEKFQFIKILRLLGLAIGSFRVFLGYRPNMLVYFFSTKRLGVLPDLLILYLSRLLGIHNILYIHGIGHRKLYENRLFRMMYNLVLRDKCSIIVLGDALRSDVEHLSRDIHVLPNTIETRRDEPNPQTTHAGDPAVVILYLSNLIREKGLLVLLEAFRDIADDAGSVKLVVGGGFSDDRFRQDVFDFIQANDLQESVEFRGPVYDDAKHELLASADIFAFPSLNEALPLVLIEAISHGLPVVAFDIGAIADIVEDSASGFLVELKDIAALTDRIRTLVQDDELRRTFGLNAAQLFAKDFSSTAYAHRQKAILDEIYARLREQASTRSSTT